MKKVILWGISVLVVVGIFCAFYSVEGSLGKDAIGDNTDYLERGTQIYLEISKRNYERALSGKEYAICSDQKFPEPKMVIMEASLCSISEDDDNVYLLQEPQSVYVGDAVLKSGDVRIIFRGYTSDNNIAVDINGKNSYFNFGESHEVSIKVGSYSILVAKGENNTLVVRNVTKT